MSICENYDIKLMLSIFAEKKNFTCNKRKKNRAGDNKKEINNFERFFKEKILVTVSYIKNNRCDYVYVST